MSMSMSLSLFLVSKGNGIVRGKSDQLALFNFAGLVREVMLGIEQIKDQNFRDNIIAICT